MEEKRAMQIIYDHDVNGLSYRSLGKKYGISHIRAYRMVMSNQKRGVKSKEVQVVTVESAALPEDLKTLKEELRLARLKIELQDLMIDISSKELGIDLRKKHGAKRSK